jgi:galactokinase
MLVEKGLIGKWPDAPDLREYLPEAWRSSWHRYAIGALYGWWYDKKYRESESRGTDLDLNSFRPSRVEITIDSDIPHGAGVSSSAALCVSLVMGLSKALLRFWNDDDVSPYELSRDEAASRAMWIEHQFAGTRCGLMDQLAIVKAERGGFLMIDFGNPSQFSESDLAVSCENATAEEVQRSLPSLPPLASSVGPKYPTLAVYPHSVFQRYQWVLLNSMVRHDLGASPYNERRESCEAGLKLIQDWYRKHISPCHLVPLSLGQLSISPWFIAQFCPDLKQQSLVDQLIEQGVLGDPTLARRVAHAVLENQRVDDAIRCLKNGDALGLNAALNASHESLARDYQVSCDEIEWLRNEALNLAQGLWQQEALTSKDTHLGQDIAILGPRMTGGGFGGSMVLGVHKAIAENFCQTITSRATLYHKKTDLIPRAYAVQPEAGLTFDVKRNLHD